MHHLASYLVLQSIFSGMLCTSPASNEHIGVGLLNGYPGPRDVMCFLFLVVSVSLHLLVYCGLCLCLRYYAWLCVFLGIESHENHVFLFEID